MNKLSAEGKKMSYKFELQMFPVCSMDYVKCNALIPCSCVFQVGFDEGSERQRNDRMTHLINGVIESLMHGGFLQCDNI